MDISLVDDSVDLSRVNPRVLTALCRARNVWIRNNADRMCVKSIDQPLIDYNSPNYDGSKIVLCTGGRFDVFIAASQLRESLGPGYEVTVTRDHMTISFDSKS